MDGPYDSKADPDARRAANTAVDEIDAMLAELHRLRAWLVSEVRKADDESMRRTEELLERCRQDRAQAAAR